MSQHRDGCDDAPEVMAWRHGSQLWIRCPFCGGLHFHGTPAGHRVAHCLDRTLAPAGYLLREVGVQAPPDGPRAPAGWWRRRNG